MAAEVQHQRATLFHAKAELLICARTMTDQTNFRKLRDVSRRACSGDAPEPAGASPSGTGEPLAQGAWARTWTGWPVRQKAAIGDVIDALLKSGGTRQSGPAVPHLQGSSARVLGPTPRSNGSRLPRVREWQSVHWSLDVIDEPSMTSGVSSVG